MICQIFFDGVEKLRASGTKAEEVGFRLEYSKTELKKCIREYPGKEVPTYFKVKFNITYIYILG